MGTLDETVQLSVSEAACLDAVREGLGTKTKIAVAASRDLYTVTKALDSLCRARLVSRSCDTSWRATPQGRRCSVRRVPDPKPKRGPQATGRVVAGSAIDRLLSALDKPKRGADLAAILGVSPQRVHQIVVKQLAYGRVRVGDRARILQIVARIDDPSVLLTREEERVLSALPDDAATAVAQLVAVTRLPGARAQAILARLRELALIEDAGMRRGRALYRLSREGQEHVQRRPQARRAKPAPPVVRSARVRDVLSYLSDHDGLRIRDVRDGLGIAQTSVNALMQYLKRKGLVRKSGDGLSAPYELTDGGREALAEMFRVPASSFSVKRP
jgi:DNA-binding MarR family transcriptional regulator